MEFTTVLLLLLIGRAYSTMRIEELINDKIKQKYSLLIRATVNVIRSCYGSRVNAIVLAGNADERLIEGLQLPPAISVSLTGSALQTALNHTADPLRRFRLHFCLITISTPSELKATLKAVKKSIWWNHMGSSLILFLPTSSEPDNCPAFEMLFTAWKMNLLNTNLVCFDRSTRISIYTYNPYTRTAPSPWSLQAVHKGDNDHPWSLFSRTYQPDHRLCTHLDFDKTSDLAGYGIMTSAMIHVPYLTFDPSKTGSSCLGGAISKPAKRLFDTLKVIPSFRLYNHSGNFGFRVRNGSDIVEDAIEGLSDIVINSRYITLVKAEYRTYPFHFSGLVAVSRRSAKVSQLEKLGSVVDFVSRMGIYLVTLVTLVFFAFVLRQEKLAAVLNVVRLVCNGSLLTVPSNLAARFYLGSLFIFVLNIQAIYQGKLASLLTKPTFRPNVNSMQDIIDGDFTVYAYKTLADLFGPPFYYGKYTKIDDLTCVKYVVKDPKGVCVSVGPWMMEESIGKNVHFSDDLVVKVPTIYVIREDWPLESRVNRILLAMFEASVFRIEFSVHYESVAKVQKYLEKLREDQQFSIMTLEELGFAFVMLGIGLSCATVCFLLEKGVSFFCTRCCSQNV